MTTHRGMFLRSSRDIEWVKRRGRRLSTNWFNLLACRRDDPATQVGIIVGRRFGVAVRRNQAKRIFRELVRHCHDDLLPGHLVLVFPKRDALIQPYAELKRIWEASLLRCHLLRPRSD